MSYSAVLDSAGRIVVPAAVRKRLNLGLGARFKVDVVAERIELIPDVDASPLVRKGNRLVLKPSGGRADAAAQVRAERDARSLRGADS
ncbi:MAG: AbrB/MazE/SpoVT family DNA-binding domain-containing protein [Burkholderiales bacterium]